MKKYRQPDYPRGIELVGGAIIENKRGQILLVQSPKWGRKWILPGGHIEAGESVIDSQVREAEEETGLKVKPVAVVSWGELINSRDFHRPAHFIYFDVYCRLVGGKLKLDRRELTAHKWLKPAAAAKLALAESYDKSLAAYIDYKSRVTS